MRPSERNPQHFTGTWAVLRRGKPYSDGSVTVTFQHTGSPKVCSMLIPELFAGLDDKTLAARFSRELTDADKYAFDMLHAQHACSLDQYRPPGEEM